MTIIFVPTRFTCPRTGSIHSWRACFSQFVRRPRKSWAFRLVGFLILRALRLLSRHRPGKTGCSYGELRGFPLFNCIQSVVIVCGGPKWIFFIDCHWIASPSSCSEGEILVAMTLGLLHTYNLNFNVVLRLLCLLSLDFHLFVLGWLVGFTEGWGMFMASQLWLPVPFFH